MGKNFRIIHPPTLSNVYQNIYFNKKTPKKPKKQTRRQKEKEAIEGNRISVENLTGCDDIICKFAPCPFNLIYRVVLLVAHTNLM